MNKKSILKVLAVVAVFFAWGISASAAEVALQPQSQLWLIGDSTLHLYESTATVLNVSLSFKSAASASLFENFKNNGLDKLEVAVPVKDMKSGEAGLDKNMQKALKAAQNPDITFHLENYQVSPAESQGVKIKAQGKLKIAGVEKPVELDGIATPLGDLLEIRGSKDLLMTDYGVKPPTIMGVIRTRNEVTIHFDLFFGLK